MIELTKMNGHIFSVNAELIETIEETPDTVLSLTTGRKFIVKETKEEIRGKFIAYKREIFQNII